MLLRLRLLLASLGGGVLLLVLLCLGAQNLNQRSSVNLGFGRTAELPTGFLVGVALVIGVISGGTATIVGSGTVTITASQAGNADWGAATPISRTLVVAKAANTIGSFTAFANQTYAVGKTVAITAPTASSGLPVVVSVKSVVSTPVTLSLNVTLNVTLLALVGSVLPDNREIELT